MARGMFHAAGMEERVRARPRAKDHWKAPPADDIALITSHFNPCGYARLRWNYDQFAKMVEAQGYPLWTIALNDDTVGNPRRTVRVWSKSVLWHKERMLNQLVKELPARYTKIAWVDHDIEFEGANWLNAASSLLEEVPVAQLYQGFERLALDGRVEKAYASSASQRNCEQGCPGAALAARRELWTQAGGLPDRIIVGGGDSFLITALKGVANPWLLGRYNRHVHEYYRECREKLQTWSGGVVGFLPGTVRHWWHGEHVNRQYVDRIELLKEFDPWRNLEVNADGMWELTESGERMRAGLERYFLGRREDG